MQNNDKLILGGHEFTSRFILGSGKFSLDLVKACVEKAEAQIITLAVRRANAVSYTHLDLRNAQMQCTFPDFLAFSGGNDHTCVRHRNADARCV